MLMTQSAFASHFLADPAAHPEKVYRKVNSLLCENVGRRLSDDKYVTGQIFSYRGDGRFAMVGAHVYPIVYRAAVGGCEVIESDGPWLGIEPELPSVPVSEIVLEPGDVLCLYSDGLIEARSGVGELFDTHRLVEAVKSAISESPDLAAAADTILARVASYATVREDDWTVLLVRRRPASAGAPSLLAAS
jgi:sigma-B regulation protein RsbU (phosphoserine phosphatase)